MATLMLTAVGSLIGGPVGGAIGAFVGRQADQLVFGGGGTRTGPRLKELSITTSSYGQPMPRNFGRMRVPGTIIWSTDLIESTRKEGGGKGQPSVRTYAYSASFAVALSSNPIERIGRIWADGNLLRGAAGDLKAEGLIRVYLGTGDEKVDPLIAADRGAIAPAFRDSAYVVFEDLQLADFGNRIPTLSFEIFAPGDGAISLGQLVPQSTQSADDVLLEELKGFSDEGGAIGSSLAALDQVYPLCCVTNASGLALSSVGSLPAHVPVLPKQLSRRSSEDAEQRHRQRGMVLGREPLALRYYDEDRDYQPGVQRAVGLRPDGRETMIDLPATMTASGARQIANSNAHRARWQDETITWRIGELDPAIGPGRIVSLPDVAGYWRIRSWEWFDGGIELGLSRFAPVLGATIAGDHGAVNTPPDDIATPTMLDAFEAPSDESSNPSNPVLFAAATSSSRGWRGSTLFMEQGGSLIELGAAGPVRAVCGALITGLEESSCMLIEPSASFEVALAADDLAFESTDVAGLGMGANKLLVGAELMQFLEATHLGANNWRLSGLLRGRAGTEDAASNGHHAGAAVALINDRLTTLDTATVPSAPDVRIAAVGRADGAPVFATLRNPGLSRRPPVPVARRMTVIGEDVWEFCWTRRARGHWRWQFASDVPLVEQSEAYLVGFGSTDTPHQVWQVTDTRYEMSSAERADLLNNYGPDKLWVKQIGTFGLSSPLLLANLT